MENQNFTVILLERIAFGVSDYSNGSVLYMEANFNGQILDLQLNSWLIYYFNFLNIFDKLK